MVDVDRLQFWHDLVSAPLSVGLLCVVLLGFGFAQPVGLEVGVYAIAVLLCVAAIAASLLVVRHRVTDWEVPVEYPELLRSLLQMCWLTPLVLMNVPSISEPEWQFLIGAPATLIAAIVTVVLLWVCYKCLTVSADKTVSNVT